MSSTDINYATMVFTLAKDGLTILDEITSEQMHILHMGIGISGESGELLDAIKKVAMTLLNCVLIKLESRNA